MRKIWVWLVKLFGWHFDVPSLEERPELMHCVVAVAPHTSALDFFVGPAVLHSVGVKPRIFIKKEFFNFITRPVLRKMGAVEVDRGNRHNNNVQFAVDYLKSNTDVCMVVTPEATRKPVKRFKRGFYEIALQAGVPIVLGYMDFKTKTAGYGPTIIPSGDFEADCAKMIEFFKPIHPRHPEGWYWKGEC
ncbi:MAG: 1-acyl-sn-glycerol-3-phosphate acyltransferase [Bacteroidales bacterium]|nr:1-acyl-sn-glycerol-3-phosphate acyltransferase [Candidatus Colimorpha merdihippi]MCQ2282517.1 1-acyl-sn-glycerol-3-phosphate acyltransferase [Bacteroidales bacterium]